MTRTPWSSRPRERKPPAEPWFKSVATTGAPNVDGVWNTTCLKMRAPFAVSRCSVSWCPRAVATSVPQTVSSAADQLSIQSDAQVKRKADDKAPDGVAASAPKRAKSSVLNKELFLGVK